MPSSLNFAYKKDIDVKLYVKDKKCLDHILENKVIPNFL